MIFQLTVQQGLKHLTILAGEQLRQRNDSEGQARIFLLYLARAGFRPGYVPGGYISNPNKIPGINNLEFSGMVKVCLLKDLGIKSLFSMN
jgi:hypothetical protein